MDHIWPYLLKANSDIKNTSNASLFMLTWPHPEGMSDRIILGNCNF